MTDLTREEYHKEMQRLRAERDRLPGERTHCPRCGSRLRYKRDGIFRWKACPKTKACGWSVFDA